MKQVNGIQPAGLNLISPMGFIPHAPQFQQTHTPAIQPSMPPQPLTPSFSTHPLNAHIAKSAITDSLDKIRDHFSQVESQNAQLRAESDRILSEKAELHKQQVMYYEMCYGLNMEVQKTNEIIKRLSSLVTQYLPHFPQEMQAHVMAGLDKAKQVSVAELSTLLGQQMAQAQGTPLLPHSLQSLRFPPHTIINTPTPTLISSATPGAMMPLIPPPNLQQLQPLQSPLQIPIKQEMMEQKNISPTRSSHPRPKSPAEMSRSLQQVTSKAKRPRGDLSPREHSSDDEKSETELVVDDDDDNQPSPNKKLDLQSGGKAFQPLTNSAKLHTSKPNHLTLSPANSRPFEGPTSSSSKVELILPPLPASIPTDPPRNGALYPFTPATGQAERAPGRPSAFTQSQRRNPPAALLTTKQTTSLNRNGAQAPSSLSPPQSANCPKDIRVLREFPHDDVVCAVWLEHSLSRIFAGDKGTIKVWDMNQSSAPVHTFNCEEDTYLRFCKLLPDRKHLIVGGELSNLYVFDIQTGGQLPVTKHSSGGPVFYALAIAPDGKHFFTCGSDGKISIWNTQTFTPINQVEGHVEGASSIDISPDGNTLYTGGLDHTVKCWDIRELSKVKEYTFSGQIFAMGVCPSSNWLAVGNENATVEVQSLWKEEQYSLNLHTQSILTLKYAHEGKWCLTGGKDSMLNLWQSPKGQQLVSKRESSSVLCCDISREDKYIVTGSGDKKTTFYEILY